MSCCCCWWWTEWRRLCVDASRLAVFQQEAQQEGDVEFQQQEGWRGRRRRTDVSQSCHGLDILFRRAASWHYSLPVGRRLHQFQRSQVLLRRMSPCLPRRCASTPMYALRRIWFSVWFMFINQLYTLTRNVILTVSRRLRWAVQHF